jgi:hypothetical protein
MLYRPHGPGRVPQNRARRTAINSLFLRSTSCGVCELEAWMNQHNLIPTMREGARHQLESAYNRLRLGLESQHMRWSRRAFEELRKWERR